MSFSDFKRVKSRKPVYVATTAYKSLIRITREKRKNISFKNSARSSFCVNLKKPSRRNIFIVRRPDSIKFCPCPAKDR